MKAALVARCNTTFRGEELPLALLRIRVTVKDDLQYSPAGLVYGQNLKLPGEYFVPSPNSDNIDQSTFVDRFRLYMRNLQQVAPRTKAEKS